VLSSRFGFESCGEIMSDALKSRAQCVQDAIKNLEYLIEHSTSEEMTKDFRAALAGCLRQQARITAERESSFAKGAG
jgi:hypothetical protein